MHIDGLAGISEPRAIADFRSAAVARAPFLMSCAGSGERRWRATSFDGYIHAERERLERARIYDLRAGNWVIDVLRECLHLNWVLMPPE